MTALSVVELERLATDADARNLDPVTVLAEVVGIADHTDDTIVTDTGILLARTGTGWHEQPRTPSLLSIGSSNLRWPR